MSTMIESLYKSRFGAWIDSVVAWPGRIQRAYMYQARHQAPQTSVLLLVKTWGPL